MGKILIFILFIYFAIPSCDRILCGDLTKELQELQDSANSIYSEHLKVENIPCESFYTRVIFKKNEVDTIIIHSVHEILYNKASGTGWHVLLVHNRKGQYMFSHNYENKIYIQTGD